MAQEEEDSEKSENSEDDEDLALITRKFRWFMKKRRQGTKRRPPVKGEPSKEKKRKNNPSFVMSVRSRTILDRTVPSSRRVRKSSRRKEQ